MVTRSIPFLNLKKIHEDMAGELDEAIATVRAHGMFINGPEVEEFEKRWAEYCKVPASAGAANGTSSLHAILSCADIGPGDEVILPSHTFIATAESVVQAGATPIFAEINPDTWLIDPSDVEKRVTSKTKAIIPVHLYGAPAPMDELNALACDKELLVIEDAAQAHGALYKGKKAGALGYAASFSFFPGKNLGAFGDAGGITSIDEEFVHKTKLYVNHGREGKFQHDYMGTNYRLDTLQAAILIRKLAHLDHWLQKRRAVAMKYGEILSSDEYKKLPLSRQRLVDETDSAWHLYVIKVKDRELTRNRLKERGIQTGVHYPIPVHLQPSMAQWSEGSGSLPVTEEVASGILSLPMCPTMSEGDVVYVCESLKEILR